MRGATGLGSLRPVVTEDGGNERLPSQTVIELRRMAETVRDVADSIDPGEDEEEGEARTV